MAGQRATTKAKKSNPPKKAAPAKPLRKPSAAPAAPSKSLKPTANAPAKTSASLAKPSPAPKKPSPAPQIPPKGDPKPAKSPLSKSELGHFRDLLLEKRREILGDVGTMETEAFKAGSNLSNMPIHMADVGTDNFEQEFTLGLIESERKILREIQEALVRIDEGTFGICMGTGKPIPKVRLEAVPWAKYSMEYARALESGQVRRDMNMGREEDAGGDDDED